MVIDIKMCRFDNVPWGFRLVGGSDFEYPLTVVKVHEASIAAEAGLRDGDVIVRINDTATSPLTHDEVNRMIKQCGNVFYFGVHREHEDSPQKQFPLMGQPETMAASPDSLLGPQQPCIEIRVTPEPECEAEPELEDEYIGDLPDRPCSVMSENTEIKLVEEEIAAVLSGESEVLKEHNVMGIFPKPGVCMSSDVLRTLNAEATKTKAERDKETKKWTTFLQKPNRPIPVSRQQLEAERRAANAYKVQIVRNSPRTSRSVSPAPSVRSVQSLQEQMPSIVEQQPDVPVAVKEEPVVAAEPVVEPQVEEPPPTDSEVPNLEQSSANEEDTSSGDSIATVQEKPSTPVEGGSKSPSPSEPEVVQEAPEEPIQKTAEELALERQLADVQKQLAALSSLPSTIQATLDAVTKQLADLLPTFKLQQEPPAPRQISLERIDEDVTAANETHEQSVSVVATNNSEAERNGADGNEAAVECVAHTNDETDDDGLRAAHDKHHHLANGHESEPEPQPARSVDQHNHSDGGDTDDMTNMRKHKPHDVIEELEEHLERKNSTKRRSKRAFGPLTPSSERPLVLPGGRRWYRPKDAYNDEFIAETLSAQAELIAGTALGVNFMKYQKPERKIDLNRSEVYKVIHHLDRQPVRGIEVRPPKVAAEVDVRRAIES